MLDVMVLNEKEKEALVIDLLNKGHSAREIAKVAYVSFSLIRKIRMKLAGGVDEEQNEDQKKKPLSIPSQAFKLFLGGKSVVEVAIERDLPTEQVLKVHSDYLTLQNMEKATRMLMENKKNLDSNTIDQTNTELRKAVKDALIRKGLINFVNDRQF